MKLIRTFSALAVISLFCSCSHFFTPNETTVDFSIGTEYAPEYETIFRVVSADNDSKLYLTAYVTGAVEKTIEKTVSIDKAFEGFKFVLNNLPREGKINILLKIDDVLTKEKKDMALFWGYAKDVDLKESNKVKITIASKGTVFDGQVLQAPTIYYIRKDLSKNPVKMSEVKQIYENGTLKSVTITGSSKTKTAYDENSTFKVITLEDDKTSGTGNTKTETFTMPQGNIWYAQDLGTALNHIYVNDVQYGISGNINVSGPATWPRIIIGNEADDSTITSQYSQTTKKYESTQEYVAAHIYLNGHTISGSDSLDTLFSIGQSTFLCFYNGAFKGKKDSTIFELQETPNHSNLLFSNVKCTDVDNCTFLDMAQGIVIFTGGSLINGKFTGSGTVALAGATINGTIDSNITTESKSYYILGDCDFTARGIPNIINGVVQ